METLNDMETLDCDVLGTRAVNRALHALAEGAGARVEAPGRVFRAGDGSSTRGGARLRQNPPGGPIR